MPRPEPLYLRSLEIVEKTLGPQHPYLARGLRMQGALYEKQGRYGEAEPLYQRALSILESARGPEDLEVAAHLSDLGRFYADTLATGVNPALQAIVLSPEGASASLSLLVETFTPSPCFAADADGCADVLRFGSIDDNLANLITGRLTTLSIALVSPFRRDEVRTGEGVDDIVTLTTFADEGALTLDIAELVLMNTVVGFAGTTEGRTPDSPLTVFKNITDFNTAYLTIQVNDINTLASSRDSSSNVSPEDAILVTIDSPLVAGTWNLRTERAAININTRALTFDSASGNVAFSNSDDANAEDLPLAVMTLSGSTGDVQQVEVNDQTFQITLVGDAGAEVQNVVRFNVVHFETPVVLRGFTVIMSLAAPNTRGAALGLNGMTSLYFDLDDPFRMRRIQNVGIRRSRVFG